MGGGRKGEISGDTEGSGREQFLMGFHTAMGVIKRDEMRVRKLIVTKTAANLWGGRGDREKGGG